jgi:hypothetical protein
VRASSSRLRWWPEETGVLRTPIVASSGDGRSAPRPFAVPGVDLTSTDHPLMVHDGSDDSPNRAG